MSVDKENLNLTRCPIKMLVFALSVHQNKIFFPLICFPLRRIKAKQNQNRFLICIESPWHGGRFDPKNMHKNIQFCSKTVYKAQMDNLLLKKDAQSLQTI